MQKLYGRLVDLLLTGFLSTPFGSREKKNRRKTGQLGGKGQKGRNEGIQINTTAQEDREYSHLSYYMEIRKRRGITWDNPPEVESGEGSVRKKRDTGRNDCPKTKWEGEMPLIEVSCTALPPFGCNYSSGPRVAGRVANKKPPYGQLQRTLEPGRKRRHDSTFRKSSVGKKNRNNKKPGDQTEV